MLIFQGLFIFVFHCLMNIQVIHNYYNSHYRTACREPKYVINVINQNNANLILISTHNTISKIVKICLINVFCELF